MIKRIATGQTQSPIAALFCQQLSQFNHPTLGQYQGDIDTQYGTRITLATDNSVYQSIPQAVVFPKSHDDVVIITKLANQQEFINLRFSPRGGGTGTNGQSLTDHIVVDMSRHMRNIIDINPEEGWVKVQTGVIKDQLNDFLRPYGFFFAPDLSTSNRATIGGMVNTDASGQGSLVYGKTSDHVLALKAVTVSGQAFDCENEPLSSAQNKTDGSELGNIYQQVLNTSLNFRQHILETFPRLNRFLTGYDLEHTLNNELTEFNLARVLTGSEGTLAFITEAKLNITPIAKFKSLINVKYDNFDSALRNAPFLVSANATSVETIDSKVLNLAKEDVVWDTVAKYITDVPEQIMNGLNIVEFNDEDQQAHEQKLTEITSRLQTLIDNKQQGVIGYQIIQQPQAIGKIYAMRKKAVGLLGNAKGKQKPIAFVEDTAVPPEHLADFIQEFKALLDSHNLEYGMFGHVDAGVLHVRPALDLTDPAQEQLLREISDQVVLLTAKYGGLMWGEHGKGYRSEYGPEFFGEELFTELRKIKAAFDPNNRLNPGKICTPINSDEKLVSVDGVKRAKFDKQIDIKTQQQFDTTVNCNGNGLCFNYDVNTPMCPSYKQSKDRANSPKGRASLMREWLRLQGPLNKQSQLRDTLSFPLKLFNSVRSAEDFSHEVKTSMDACLACKACSTACPIKVDVPNFRSKFIEQYHQRYLRPVRDHLVANIEALLPQMAKLPTLVNALMLNPISKWVTQNVVGFYDAPRISFPLKSKLSDSHFYNVNHVKSLIKQQRQKTVFLVQDPFTSYYEAQLVVDTITALEKLGFKPVILPFYPNGKPQHVKGFLGKFGKTAARATQFYNDIAEFDIPMVGLDASMVFTYRDEYVKALGEDKVKFKVKLLSEWLGAQDISHITETADSKACYLISHCTEKSILANTPSTWQQIFSNVGMTLNTINTGCCGMAGTYGHEKQNQNASKELFDLSWRPALDDHREQVVLATGFSCRSQVKRLTNQKLLHPIQYLAQHLTRS